MAKQNRKQETRLKDIKTKKAKTITLNRKEYYETIKNLEVKAKVSTFFSFVFLALIISFGAIVLIRDANAKEVKVPTFNELSPNYVFLGDSITDYYPLEDYYEDLPVVNSSVSGYRTTNILEEMDQLVYRYNPSKVFVLIGVNDLLNKEEEDQEAVDNTVNNIKEIIQKIQKERPQAKIYVESIYPTKEFKRKKKLIQKVNEKVEEFCEDKNLTYIDLFTSLKDEEDHIKDEYSDDGLHLNQNGYDKVTEILMPYLKEK